MSPNAQLVATGSDDGTVRLWLPDGGAALATFGVGKTPVTSVAFNNDSDRIAVGSDDAASAWDVTGRRLFPLAADRISDISFSPSGASILTADRGGTVKLFRNSDGALAQTLSGHTAAVNNAVFNPDGRTIATASDDQHDRRGSGPGRWAARSPSAVPERADAVDAEHSCHAREACLVDGVRTRQHDQRHVYAHERSYSVGPSRLMKNGLPLYFDKLRTSGLPLMLSLSKDFSSARQPTTEELLTEPLGYLARIYGIPPSTLCNRRQAVCRRGHVETRASLCTNLERGES
jgi:WD domain, G-beta repeat